LLHPFGDLSKTEKTSLHHSFTAVSGGQLPERGLNNQPEE